VPRTARLAVGGPAGETTDFDADHKFSQLERMLLTAAVCTEMPAPPSSRALLLGGGSRPPQQQSAAAGGGVRLPQQQSVLLGGGSAMSLVVQGGYRAECGRSAPLVRPAHVGFLMPPASERPPRALGRLGMAYRFPGRSLALACG